MYIKKIPIFFSVNKGMFEKKTLKTNNRLIRISAERQTLSCYEEEKLCHIFPVSTAKNGLGEQMGSECTPRGWHSIVSIIGNDAPVNSVFVGRQWTGEIYSQNLAEQYPDRDWILTCIMQLDGLEPGKNKGANVDSLSRYIYIHGTPDTTQLNVPGSRGCVRMRNSEIKILANWVELDTCVFIE